MASFSHPPHFVGSPIFLFHLHISDNFWADDAVVSLNLDPQRRACVREFSSPVGCSSTCRRSRLFKWASSWCFAPSGKKGQTNCFAQPQVTSTRAHGDLNKELLLVMHTSCPATLWSLRGVWVLHSVITEPPPHTHQFLGYRLQIKSAESLLRLQEGCNFYWECLIGHGLAWIAPLKITDINSCMAAIQPDTSTCLAREQTAIRKEKVPNASSPCCF